MPCCMTESRSMVIRYVRKTNSSLHEEVVRMCSCSVWWMWTTLPMHKMQSTFVISRVLLIENTLKCPFLNKSSRGTQQIMVRFIALASHLNPPVEMCSMHQRVMTGWLSWRNWASQMRMVHLNCLETTNPSHNGDCPEGPEKHVYYQCRESGASHTRYAETWPWVYFDSITQRQAWATCFRKLQEQLIVYLGASL